MVFEGDSSALDERFWSQQCVLKFYPSAGPSTSAVATASKHPLLSDSAASSNIWAGSDSDFMSSPEVASGSDTAAVGCPVKRRKL
ncbi:hypothetical protein F442_15208 [Phytophthora nicotianae P10297]|uniref:Uncharacterized protein n=1 Tax=Phytophthora nicotianae P10297 TaxID=1317064 RepID=W2YPQ1_PHYNI|nr:hypothetical protein F442_15208 [Phytophthora nicotianae P10297]